MNDKISRFLALWVHTNVAFTDYSRLSEYDAYTEKVRALVDYADSNVKTLPEPTCSYADGLLGIRWVTEHGCMTVEVSEDGSFFWMFSTPVSGSECGVVMCDDFLPHGVFGATIPCEPFLCYLRKLIGGSNECV